MFRVLRFKTYDNLKEQATAASVASNSKNNRNGVMHELLVGKHLNGGKHMPKHPDVNGDSPQEAHDKLKTQFTKEEYHHANKRAKATASALVKHHKENHPNHKMHAVSWTSKPGDLKRSTKIEASQKQDTSDIVMHSKKPDGSDHHTGVSLKVTSKSSVNSGSSNHGHGTMHSNAEKFHKDHHDAIHKAHPELKGMNGKKRREWMKHPDNKKKAENVRNLNAKILRKHSAEHHKELEGHLKSGNKERINKVKQHLKHTLAAKKTPMEKEGHSSIKSVAFEHKGEFRHHVSRPGHDYDHILKDPDFHHNTSIHNTGTGHVIKHKGKNVASFTYKFNSQSDPKSSITAVGNTKHKMKDGKVVKD